MKRLFPAEAYLNSRSISGCDRVQWYRFFLVLILVLFPVAGSRWEAAWAKEPIFQASQAVSAYPGLQVYLDVADERGVPLPPPEASLLQAVVGGRELPVRSVRSFAETGQGVGYVFLVDISRSLGEDELAGMRRAISVWVDHCREQDRFALVTFGSEVQVLQDFTAEKGQFLERVRGLHPTDMLTSLHGALLEAQRLGSRQDPDLPVRRVVIVLSDGKNEALFGETAREVLRRLREASAPIFALGYYHPPFDGKQEYLQQLERFARASGGTCFRPDDEGLGAVFERLRSRIDNTWVVDMDVADISPEGQSSRVEIGYREDDLFLSDGFDVRLLPPVPTSGPDSSGESPEDILPVSGAKAQVSGAQVDPAPTARASAQEEVLEAVPVAGAVEPKAGEKVPGQGKTQGRRSRAFILGGGLLLLSLLMLRIFARKSTSGKESAVVPPPSAPVPEPEQTQAPLQDLFSLPLRLEVFHGRRVVRSFRLILSGSQVLGRSGESDIQITDDPTVSARHCELVLNEKRLAVRDLGSTNGTFVNNLRTEGLTSLEDGDMLRVGQTSIHLVFEGTPGSSGGEVR